MSTDQFRYILPTTIGLRTRLDVLDWILIRIEIGLLSLVKYCIYFNVISFVHCKWKEYEPSGASCRRLSLVSVVWDASSSQGYTPAINSPVPIYIRLGGRRHCESKVSCLKHNSTSQPGLLDPQARARTVRPLRIYRNEKVNRPFPSSLVPLFQTESKCKTFHMKMSSARSFFFMQIKVIFIRMVSHLDSLWNRGTRNSEMAYSVPLRILLSRIPCK